MSTVERLLAVTPQFTMQAVTASAKRTTIEAMGWAEAGLTVRAVRGRKSRTTADLFDEFAAALQFPYYFGENWPAFDDCLTDLGWLPLAGGLVIVIHEAGEVMAQEAPKELQVLVRKLVRAHETFVQPVNDGEWWDRPAVPFHVVLHDPDPGGFARWAEAGASLAAMNIDEQEF